MSGSSSSNPAERAAVADQPLGLTVHSLPALDQADAASARTVSGRWKMLAVLLVCAAPVLASYFTYYVVRPTSVRAFGTLINPQRPLPDVAVQLPDGTTGNLRALKGPGGALFNYTRQMNDAVDVITQLVGGGVLDRNPKAHILFAEHSAGWLWGLAERMDEVYHGHSNSVEP